MLYVNLQYIGLRQIMFVPACGAEGFAISESSNLKHEG